MNDISAAHIVCLYGKDLFRCHNSIRLASELVPFWVIESPRTTNFGQHNAFLACVERSGRFYLNDRCLYDVDLDCDLNWVTRFDGDVQEGIKYRWYWTTGSAFRTEEEAKLVLQGYIDHAILWALSKI